MKNSDEIQEGGNPDDYLADEMVQPSAEENRQSILDAVLRLLRPAGGVSASTEDVQLAARLLRNVLGTEIVDEEVRKARLLASTFTLMGHETRILILKLLKEHQGNLSVLEIVETINHLEQPTISHHLKIMRDANIVGFSKHGLNAYYYINTDKLEEKLEEITTFLRSLM